LDLKMGSDLQVNVLEENNFGWPEFVLARI